MKFPKNLPLGVGIVTVTVFEVNTHNIRNVRSLIVIWRVVMSNYVHIYIFFSYVFKSCIGLMGSNCVNEKVVYTFSYVFQKLCWFRAIKLFKSQENRFGMRNTQYSIGLIVHKQPSVFNTTYTKANSYKVVLLAQLSASLST